MDHADGETTAAERLAQAVRAAEPSAVLPATTARIEDVEPTADGRLRLVLTIDGRSYGYGWPERGTVDEVIASAPAGHPLDAWATTVLANVAETLEADDRGPAWAIERGVLRPGP
jgi:hypothetical protein